MKKIPSLFISFCFLFLGLYSPKHTIAQTFGFNIHHLAVDSPQNISNMLNYLSQNCQTTIVRFWGYESLGGLGNIQKVLDNAPAGMQFIITLEDFPYGPAEMNPKAWFGNDYRNSYRNYVQRVVSNYKGNSKILAWEIMNEPHCKGDSSCTPVLVAFMNDISTLIKSNDPSTMVAPGLMGLGNVGERFGEGYDQITALPNINANSCHFYDGNAGGCQTAMSITQSRGKYFYVGEAGYIGQGSGDAGSCTSTGCTNVCNEAALTNRAALVQSNLNQLGGANAFLLWQFSPTQSPLLSCDKFSVFPNDPVCLLDGSLVYTPLPQAGQYSCNLNDSGNQTSRPVSCQDCNQTPKMSSSCATDFKVSDQVDFERHEGDQCNGQYWVEKPWGGTVTLDLNSTTIPFVGNDEEEDEQYYLADYFEGTYPYYQNSAQTPYNAKSGEEQRQAFIQGGVWQKLATQDMQDTMKISLIRRAIASKNGLLSEGVIRDYNVTYNGVTKKLSEFDNHFPPANEIERSDWLQNDEYGRLWFMVPMFSREDTKGSVVPYLGSMQKDQFTINNFEKDTVEKVPHLARLYEVSRAINQLLLPASRQTLRNADGGSQESLASNNEPKLLASSKVLLADAVDTFNISANATYSEPNVSVSVTFISQGCDGDIKLAVDGGITAGPNGWNGATPYTYPPQWTGSPIVVNRGQSKTVTYTGIIHRGPRSCTHQTSSTSCTFTVSAVGEFTTNCGPAVPVPVCGAFSAQSVPQCEKEAESGPGDGICCGPISSTLRAVDRIENTQHKGCDPFLYPFGIGDPCHNTVEADVQRSLGVALAHPYLEEIWKDTTDSVSGFINIWRPADLPVFEPKEAKSTINYTYTSSGKPHIEPGTGDFYYPYLGGIFNAKNWLVNTLETKEQQERQVGP